ncbi:MAG: hypothetical protein KC422_24905 [Trueperaceae bacterium]|nr:hypothetical protein [Trueperaceae bacterium]
MKVCSSQFAKLIFLCLLGLAYAQEAGVLSYIDTTGAGSEIAACLATEPDPRLCSPHVEVLIFETFNACGGNLSGCEEIVTLSLLFMPEEAGQNVVEDMENAWQHFLQQTLAQLNQDINKFMPCWVLIPCPPLIDWTCVSNRIADALATAYADFQPQYWQEVYTSIATHMPLAAHWQTALPDGGAVLSPVVSLLPKPAQYADLIEAPRDPAYYFQGPLFPRLPVPYLPEETSETYGGLTELEGRKRVLEPATLSEYEQFGFVSFFQVYGDYRLELLFDPLAGPYLVAACLIPVPPFVVPFPVPVPGPLFAARALSDWPTVPEGYPIPRIKGIPLY